MSTSSAAISSNSESRTLYPILFAVSLVHLLNDAIQAVIPAVYPILKDSMQLTYTQIGWIGFALNFTACILQPAIGFYSDRKPNPYALPLGMFSTFIGMFLLAYASSYPMLIFSVILVGLGSAVFHPESSRVSYLAAGPRRGLAQSIFQVGGNTGQALAPLMTLFIFIPLGQKGAIWFTVVAGVAILILLYIAKWYRSYLENRPKITKSSITITIPTIIKRKRMLALLLLVLLVFVRSWYFSGISNYYQFYLMDTFHITLKTSQLHIFLFLLAGAIGTFFGGPLADRFGMKTILWVSMLGAVPFSIMVPFLPPSWSIIALFLDGLILLSSFSVSVVYAQHLFPQQIGTISGLIVGFAFGMGAVGAIILGKFIDLFGLAPVVSAFSLLPLLGLLTFFLPSDQLIKSWYRNEKIK